MTQIFKCIVAGFCCWLGMVFIAQAADEAIGNRNVAAIKRLFAEAENHLKARRYTEAERAALKIWLINPKDTLIVELLLRKIYSEQRPLLIY